jgi:hypothetical protein
MPQASAAAVNEDAHLALPVDAHALGGISVVDLLDDLHLGVVVAGAKRAELRETALLGPHAHLGGVSVEHPACDARREERETINLMMQCILEEVVALPSVFFTVFLVLGPSVALSKRPVNAHFLCADRGVN